MTTLELRLLQLLSREGGRLVAYVISTRTSRFSAEERNLALHSLEALDLVKSGREPVSIGGRKGGGRLVYWLTPAGTSWVKAARERGEIRDKPLGPKTRAKAKGRTA